MMKFRFLCAALIFLPLALFAQGTTVIVGDAPPARPNVLLIAIDDLNDYVGYLGGHPDTVTPNIDRLAEQGTAFTNAHCQAPACNPSRSSIMYGLRPSTSGIYINWPLPWQGGRAEGKTTLTRWFAQNGYFTATTGKIYHNSALPNGEFDLVGPRPKLRIEEDQEVRTDRPGTVHTLWDWGPQTYDETLMQDYADATWAIEQLGQMEERGKPFFLAVGFYRPHVPFYAPQRLFDAMPVEGITTPPVNFDDWDDIPEIVRDLTKMGNPSGKGAPPFDWALENNAWKEMVQAYLVCIRWTDEQVGRLLNALDASPHADNTIVVLYSDHGFHMGEKLRFSKFALWERATKVPFIIAGPGVTPNQLSGKPVELLSIYPTLLELCGLPENPAVEGHSLMPLLIEPEAEWPHYAITTHGEGNHAARSERYRYIRYHTGSEELYDLQSDPNEWTNLAAGDLSPELQAIRDELAAALPADNASSQ